MKLDDFRKLKKLLTLATTDNDHEALSAWRTATKIVIENGLTWEMVLNRVVTVLNPITGAPNGVDASDDEDVLSDEIFERALDRTKPGSFRDTLLSIQAQWENGRMLTDRQKATVMSAASR